MAITTSAKKAHRQSLRRNAQNDIRREAVRGAYKAVRESAGKENKEALAAAYKAIDKAVKRGLITKNTAARRKSKFARMLRRV